METRGGPLEGIGRICPDGYKLLDHIRDCRQGGGTALLFRDSLTVKKVGGGAKMSFEFSEWIVQLASSYGLRLVVVYRPQSDSDDHRIPMTTFFNDFTDLLETVILCKEQLVIVGDFNIHVDVLINSDSTKFRACGRSNPYSWSNPGPYHHPPVRPEYKIHTSSRLLFLWSCTSAVSSSFNEAFFLQQDSLIYVSLSYAKIHRTASRNFFCPITKP